MSNTRVLHSSGSSDSSYRSQNRYGKIKRRLASWFYDENKWQLPKDSFSHIQYSRRDDRIISFPLNKYENSGDTDLRKILRDLKFENSKLASQLNTTLATAKKQSDISRQLNIRVQQLEQEIIRLKFEIEKFKKRPLEGLDVKEIDLQFHATTYSSRIVSMKDMVSGNLSGEKNLLSMENEMSVVNETNTGGNKHSIQCRLPSIEEEASEIILSQTLEKIPSALEQEVAADTVDWFSVESLSKSTAVPSANEKYEPSSSPMRKRPRPVRSATRNASYKEPHINAKMRRTKDGKVMINQRFKERQCR